MIQRYYKAAFLDKGYLLDSYNHKNLIIEKINDPRLTPDMDRIRSGSTQLFRRNYGDRQFTSEENADVVLRHNEQHYYAEFINGDWYWVNGCYECSGDKRDWMGYSTCEKHDVCAHCSITRKLNKGSCWGRKEGWVCTSCKDIEHEKLKREALEAFDEDEFCEWDYEGLDTPKCPYCNYEIEHCDHDLYEADNQETKCPRCDNKFKVTAEPRVSFSCERIEKSNP